MSSFSFDIDPLKVLGVSDEATLEQIREAYRQKSKLYHPDKGGEEWAFRIISQAYEMLSTARVMRASRLEDDLERRRVQPTAAPPRPQPQPTQPKRDAQSETVLAGLYDRNVAPGRIVAVEHMCVRYLWEQAAYLWIGQKGPDDERFLSCSLNLSWPDDTQGQRFSSIPEAPKILANVSDIFDHLVVATRGVSSRSNVEEDRFSGWISYSNFDRSWKALKTLHDALRARGLGLRQWTRDLFIPRAWD